MSESRDDYRDALLYRADGGDLSAMASFFNIISNAVSYGMVMGSARTGLGTDCPVGPSIPGESLYYQGLHAYSAFDWEFERQLLLGAEVASLPRSLALLAGRVSSERVEALVDEELEAVRLAQRIVCTVAPSLEPFAFRRVDEADVALPPDRSPAKYSDSIVEGLRNGTLSKLKAMDALACHTSSGPLQERLEAMVAAFAPLCTTFTAHFDPKDRRQSYTRFSVYLPAIHSLHAPDADDPATWYLERGVAETPLPSPVQVSAAQITHMSYLCDADRSQHQAIKMEVIRDFGRSEHVRMVVGFGRLFLGGSEELLGFNTEEYRDALYVSLRTHVPEEPGDTAATRAAKEKVNQALGGFTIQARIHKLTLELRREDASVGEGEEQLLQPQFQLDASRLSFRIQRYTESAAERLSLSAAGFTCEPKEGTEGYACWREFWTWDRLREFFGGESANGLAGMLVTSRERLLGHAIGRATKLILDQSIESIERSLDHEIATIVSDYLERYATARDAVAGRLHHELF